MTETTPKQPWEQRLHQAAATVEDELRRVISYINEEVVPEVRQNSSQALRSAAGELERLAKRMDDRAATRPAAATPPSSPPKSQTGGTPQP